MTADVRHRIAVDVERDATGLDAELARLCAKKPSGRAELTQPFGFSFRREPLVLHFVATGFALGMALLLTELSIRVHRISPVTGALAGFSLLAAFVSMGTFVWSFWRRDEVRVEGDRVVCRSLVGSRVRNATAIEADRIVAVLVVGAEGARPRVVLAGPRHAILAEVFAMRALDPESLAPWLAEMVAVVARRATVSAG